MPPQAINGLLCSARFNVKHFDGRTLAEKSACRAAACCDQTLSRNDARLRPALLTTRFDFDHPELRRRHVDALYKTLP